MMNKNDDKFVKTPTQDGVNDTDDELFKHISTFVSSAQTVINQEIDDWLDGEQMYEDCFNPEDDKVQKYNPSLLQDIVQNKIDELKLADYILKIPDSDAVHRQIVKDYITYIENESGLYSEIRDDDKGALSWSLLGNLILWWGKASDAQIKKGIPIQFQSTRLSQTFLPVNVTRIRDYNGEALAREAMVVFEDPYYEIKAMYPDKKNSKIRSLTGKKFNYGKLPLTTVTSYLQQVDTKDNDTEQYLTQRGYYYNIDKGIFRVIVGSNATIVEQYDNNDPNLPDYPFKLDGVNYLPFELLKFYPVMGKLYGKGLYHKFAKIARNDVRRRNMAHQYAEGNVNPDKFVQMSDDRYENFLNQLSLSRQVKAEGDDSYIQLSQGEEIKQGDLRTAQLSNEFERMLNDDLQQIRQGGILLQDVDYPASQTATTTLALEKNKNRLINHVIRINAGSAAFLRRVIVQFVQDYISKTNKAPVATNATVKLLEAPENVQNQAVQMMQQGTTEEEVKKYMYEQGEEGNKEGKIEYVTAGEVAEYIKKKGIYVQADYSAWNDTTYQLRLLQTALEFGVGTPAGANIQKQILSLLGQDVYAQDLEKPTEVKNLPPMDNQSQNAVQGLNTTAKNLFR
jgi:hypothetical protein